MLTTNSDWFERKRNESECTEIKLFSCNWTHLEYFLTDNVIGQEIASLYCLQIPVFNIWWCNEAIWLDLKYIYALRNAVLGMFSDQFRAKSCCLSRGFVNILLSNKGAFRIPVILSGDIDRHHNLWQNAPAKCSAWFIACVTYWRHSMPLDEITGTLNAT